MAVNIETNTVKIQNQTVATDLVITRTVKDDGTPEYTGTLQYATHSFYVDDNGNITGVLSLNQSRGNVIITPDKANTIFATQLVDASGKSTCLGEVLADMMDKEIQEAITPVVQPVVPPVQQAQ
jgi:hypothetical protein